MGRPIQFAIVIIIGAGLMIWLVLAQRYQYFSGADNVLVRNDGFTGTRQALRCKEQPTGKSVLRVIPSSASSAVSVGPEQVAHLPLSVEKLNRVNQMRQERHLPNVDRWGRKIDRECRWVDIQGLGTLLLSLGVAAAAAPAAPVQYTLTFYTPVGVISMGELVALPKVGGTIGGVEVNGEEDGADWYVAPTVSPTTTFASGKLDCAQVSCTFTMTDLLGQRVNIHSSPFTLGRPVAGPVRDFSTRSAWVSAVKRWADLVRLKPDLKAQILAQAAGGGH